MIDTIEAKISVDAEYSVDQFTELSRYSNGVGVFDRFVIQHGSGESYAPRLTYRRHVERPDHGTLTVEFSVPHMIQDMSPYNPNDIEIQIAFDRVDRFVRVMLGSSAIQSIREWRVMRMDCAYNWIAGEYIDEYMVIMQSLQCQTMTKQIHNRDGVTWLSQSRRRALKFYNKRTEDTWHRWTTLRFEVSNYHSAVQYMCDHWFKCSRLVGECVTVAHSLDVLHRMFDRLGLNSNDIYRSDEIENIALYKAYGSSASQAQWILHMYRMFGVESYKKGYTNQGTYYKWLKRLRVDGFISNEHTDSSVPALQLPPQHKKPKTKPVESWKNGTVAGQTPTKNASKKL